MENDDSKKKKRLSVGEKRKIKAYNQQKRRFHKRKSDAGLTYSELEDKPLTRIQERFIDIYMSKIDMPQKQAAIEAGYAPSSASASAIRLLTCPNVRKAIKQRQEELKKKFEITRERVVQEYASIAFSDVTEFYERLDDIESGEDTAKLLKASDELNTKDTNSTTAISGIQFAITPQGRRVIKKIDFHDKVRALDALAKYLGIFEADNRQKQPIINIDDIIRGIPDPEFAEKVRIGLAKRMMTEDNVDKKDLN